MNPYRQIFEALPLPGLLLESFKGKFLIIDANKKYCELFGKKIEEVQGQNYLQLDRGDEISEKFLEQISFSLRRTIESGEPCCTDCLEMDLEGIFKRENKKKFWRFENFPLKNEHGEVIQVLHLAIDKTGDVLEKQEMEQQLIYSMEQQKHFIRKNPDGLYSLDKDGNFLSLNEGLVKMAEMPEEELLNQSFLPFCAPQDLERTVNYFQKAVAGEEQVFEAEFISAKGAEMILEILLIPIKGEGNISAVYGIAKDRTSQRRKEEELFKNQKKFQALVQEGSDLVAILEQDGKFKFINNPSENILGNPPSFYYGRNALDFLHPVDKDRVMSEFSNLGIGKHIRIEAFRFKDGAGKWRWLETHASNFLNDPYVEGIVTNTREVTQLVEQSNQIKQLFERYTMAAEATEDLIYDWNLVTDEVIRFHKSNESFLGYSREEIDRRDFWKNHIHPEEIQNLKQLLKESLANPAIPNIKTQYRFLRANGTYATIMDRGNIVRNEKGKPIRLIGATSDMSQVMNNKDALKMANKRFSYAMKATKEMIWDWNIVQGHIKRSGAFKRVFGYSTRKTPSGENFWFEKILEEDRERIRKSIYAALGDSRIKKWREEYCFLKNNGEKAYVIDRGYILRDKEGKAIRMVGAVLDVTQSRRMLQEIKKQNQVLKEVAWEQAHIVRAPLARLKGLLSLLEEESYEEWSREELLDLIWKSADEVDIVISNIIRKTEKIGS